MTAQEKKPMLTFKQTEMPSLPIVDIISVGNDFVTSLDQLPHASIDVVEGVTATKRKLFVRFDNNRWDNNIHDPMKITLMMDEWLKQLQVELNAGIRGQQEYEFAVAYNGGYYSPPSPMFRPLGWDQAGQDAGFAADGRRWEPVQHARRFQGGGLPPMGMRPVGFGGPDGYNFPGADPLDQHNPKVMARRWTANNLLTTLTEHSGRHSKPRLATTWYQNVKGEDELYIEGTIGGNVGVTIRREGIKGVGGGMPYLADGEPILNHIPGTVSFGGKGPTYNFAFYHTVLGESLRDVVTNNVLKEAFQQVWTKFNNACAFELKHLELIFTNE
jgi:hypothetical protein